MATPALGRAAQWRRFGGGGPGAASTAASHCCSAAPSGPGPGVAEPTRGGALPGPGGVGALCCGREPPLWSTAPRLQRAAAREATPGGSL
jgi:hypothetical protein